MAETVLDFLLENLVELLTGRRSGLILVEKSQVEYLYKEIIFLRSFVQDSAEICDEQVKKILTQIRQVAYEALDKLDSLVVGGVLTEGDQVIIERIGYGFDYFSWLRNFADEIRLIKKEVMEISDDKRLYGEGISEAEVSLLESPYRVSSSTGEQESVVGFDDEAMRIIEELTGVKRQLEVIPIVGMGGLGKTTLARKVYNDPLIVYHFYVRGWTFVSQVYEKRDLLISILSSVVQQRDEIYTMDEEKLGEELYRRLKGKRYLIVMDDIWAVEAWHDLRKYLPNDSNGSRIIVTTRITDVASYIKPNSLPHCLRFLTQDESWVLLEQKTFQKVSCPPELKEIGMEIAAKCQGLPLAVVVVAGLLTKKEKTKEWWKQVGESVSSYIIDDTKQFIDILLLSYNHLPRHLKSCFLYLGTFPKNHEIAVWRLTCLWVAEGFVQEVGEKSLHDMAEDYLMDLIDRSLVIVSKKRSIGGIKSCRIHDMLHDLCLRKAEEKKSLHQIYRYEQAGSLSSALYKFARILDLGHNTLTKFPTEILQLFHLRYLALYVLYVDRIPPSISNLWNLETLILCQASTTRVTLPCDIWKMVKLRLLFISPHLDFELPCSNHVNTYVLDGLHTLSNLGISSSTNDVLSRIPNLRKVGFFRSSLQWEFFPFPDLANHIHLHTLKLIDRSWNGLLLSIVPLNKFPPNLMKLTLTGGHISTKVISALGMLPNLEVLKLKDSFFKELVWETSGGGFSRLKFLKIQDAKLNQWIASSDDFPSLEQLLLDGCEDLEEIPIGLGDIPTLEMIELLWPSLSCANSARRIQKEQHNMGNDGLKIIIYPPK